MRILKLIGAAAALMVLASAAAQAAPGFSTANVNLRTGPDIDFPAIDVIPEGDDVEIMGCLDDESWCEVLWDGDRGWVFSEYLAFDGPGGYVSLLDVGPAAYHVPFVTFAARSYWDRYYVGRPWYSERARWYAHHVRPRRDWHRPPSGRRNAGWWRKNYRAPSGLRPPPHHGWKRPSREIRQEARRHRRNARQEYRQDRRDDRRDRRDNRRDDRRDDRRDHRHDRH
ncbi:Ligand-binding protein SH3 [Candidatus Filomicrobium marinum]|uniref:Ligand-binding protein SH3 n=2 Tax=Filomicrobium TaxID=119044 RepID=A0A0D6JDH9_9HYPH|nr:MULTISPECIES: SH3 domain-containing protein [Filomicrobium]MCV0368350.1 SH3 domain-containing protein [Filomicrobium sp.]CFX11935.1 Ligand-binding protein SH3 [Candidatus Filomicrobium marinum]CPR17361.1 Ligand-binding protein SH3 [Candidatus Filomicrobium marinum]SDO35353.1 Uncharacterized conserved protein YraI [Filomicrobium insigne]